MLAVFWPVILGQLAMVTPLPSQIPAEVPAGYTVLSERFSAGPRSASGDQVTVHFRIVSGDRVLADTESRGLPFTFVLGDVSVAPLLSDLAVGLSDRSVRTAMVPASLALVKVPSLFPGGVGSDLKVYIRVIGLVK